MNGTFLVNAPVDFALSCAAWAGVGVTLPGAPRSQQAYIALTGFLVTHLQLTDTLLARDSHKSDAIKIVALIAGIGIRVLLTNLVGYASSQLPRSDWKMWGRIFLVQTAFFAMAFAISSLTSNVGNGRIGLLFFPEDVRHYWNH